MIDISDGLLADLGHIAAASAVLIDLSRAALGPDDQLLAAAHFLGRTDSRSPSPEHTALTWVLAGGEDHSLAATFPAGTALPPRWTVIGTVRPVPGRSVPGGAVPAGPASVGPGPGPGSAGPAGPGPGVVVDSEPWAQAPGWDHFA
jgi:thiamine-monophosphate kinase